MPRTSRWRPWCELSTLEAGEGAAGDGREPVLVQRQLVLARSAVEVTARPRPGEFDRRLRTAREAQRLTLCAIEILSAGRFSPVTLGS